MHTPPCDSCKRYLISDVAADILNTTSVCNVCATFDNGKSALLYTDPHDDFPMDAIGRASLYDGLC